MAKGLSRERERERGKGWVFLVPSFLLHNVLGGVFGAGDGDGDGSRSREGCDGGGEEGINRGAVVSASSVCEAVIGWATCMIAWERR